MTRSTRLSEARSGQAPRSSHADHYSYQVYADAGMAESFDARRFSGPIGQLLAGDQEDVLAAFLAPVEGASVLDVGTGTGRAAIALAHRGARVTGVDASEEMLAVARRRALDANAAIELSRGDAHALTFRDRSFDAVVCLRVLMHTPDWRRALAELCRVANGRVVFDYPALCSMAALQSAARRVAHTAGVRTEPYRVFSDRAIRDALDDSGFRVVRTHRQFVLPIALHKQLGKASATRAVEGTLRRAGLTGLFGSPVTVLAERCAS